MQTDEYRRMFELEDRYWWFVGRRNLALKLLRKFLPSPLSGMIVPGMWRGVGGGASGAVVLDLGCGTGAVSQELVNWSRPVSLDMSPVALAFCQERGLARLVRADGKRLPIGDSSVDAITALDIFEHIEDDKAAFSEAARVLKPGGLLVLSVPAFKTLCGPHDVALMHHRRYRRSEVLDLLKASGLDPVRVSYSVFFLFPVVVLVRAFEKRKKGQAKASLVKVPTWMNRALIGLQNVEASLISVGRLPWGSSVVAVARKPSA